MRIYFTLDGDVIEMTARAEGPGGMVGDMRRAVGPGEETGVDGLSYGDLQAAGGGVVVIADDGGFAINPPQPEPDPYVPPTPEESAANEREFQEMLDRVHREAGLSLASKL